MPYTPGPKQQQLEALRKNKMENTPKPSKADLRSKVAKIKPMTNKGARRGR